MRQHGKEGRVRLGFALQSPSCALSLAILSHARLWSVAGANSLTRKSKMRTATLAQAVGTTSTIRRVAGCMLLHVTGPYAREPSRPSIHRSD